MEKNIVYADTVGIDGTVYPTVGENIRNSNLLAIPKEIFTVKVKIEKGENLTTDSNVIKGGPVHIYYPNKDIFLIRLINKNIISASTFNFLRPGLLTGNMAIAIRDNVTSNMSGEVTLLIGVM